MSPQRMQPLPVVEFPWMAADPPKRLQAPPDGCGPPGRPRPRPSGTIGGGGGGGRHKVSFVWAKPRPQRAERARDELGIPRLWERELTPPGRSQDPPHPTRPRVRGGGRAAGPGPPRGSGVTPEGTDVSPPAPPSHRQRHPKPGQPRCPARPSPQREVEPPKASWRPHLGDPALVPDGRGRARRHPWRDFGSRGGPGGAPGPSRCPPARPPWGRQLWGAPVSPVSPAQGHCGRAGPGRPLRGRGCDVGSCRIADVPPAPAPGPRPRSRRPTALSARPHTRPGVTGVSRPP
ncbi:proline-rich protein 2-like [Myiozetetes cayanensis]|uniref:proline-rich protein 2-like n=1 Tax=Myiozetetes cayanensis TaxID=478635 RepID=UPI00215E4B37|nr:proline-rich protein 2-like [Myiozetetes cayanensis]